SLLTRRLSPRSQAEPGTEGIFLRSPPAARSMPARRNSPSRVRAANRAAQAGPGPAALAGPGSGQCSRVAGRHAVGAFPHISGFLSICEDWFPPEMLVPARIASKLALPDGRKPEMAGHKFMGRHHLSAASSVQTETVFGRKFLLDWCLRISRAVRR